MPRNLICLVTCLGFFSAGLPSRAQSVPSITSQVTSYPEKSEGLQQLIEDIFAAAKANDKDKEAGLVRSLVMPENTTWFKDEFGPGFGSSLDAAYHRSAQDLERQIRVIYEEDVERGWMTAKIIRYEDPATVNSPTDHFLNCMDHIVPLYRTAIAPHGPAFYFGPPDQGGHQTQNAGDLDGYFAYAQGGFRFVPTQILMMLPRERPVRIQLDMNVMRSKLINPVWPKYPEQALNKRISGTVGVDLILDVHGNTKEIKGLEGDPILTQAVLEAVKQWRFEPTTLDGDPVEVELELKVPFAALR